jgi:cytochrome c biogenesis protein CcdA
MEDSLVTLILIGLVGGLITGISPCVLPVLPVIFLSGGAQAARDTAAGRDAGAARPASVARTPISVPAASAGDTAAAPAGPVGPAAPAGHRAGMGRRPYLIVAGLALSFSVFTLLGTLVLSALPVPNDIIRWTGLVVLVAVGIAMMVPRVQDLLERPFSWITADSCSAWRWARSTCRARARSWPPSRWPGRPVRSASPPSP